MFDGILIVLLAFYGAWHLTKEVIKWAYDVSYYFECVKRAKNIKTILEGAKCS